ncbi:MULTISPECIES: agmatinase [unclassified Microbacterium]|uniref:agmatinase n=1 Tax=unclassified Microbacterium TaxID=2609290 RepID=UPI00076B05F8|nr:MULTISPECIES: agmatinase [unclassified Microbacterium]AMG82861.1 agmatinase [Microbacterium sp. PAMC 28756]KYJ97267.1 agmatinase [Microbacterium sp. CH1]MCT1397139.1 agmatinase [Microbacterium sp. p3-SID338]PMC03032.1 agmatinase [Microbacterium sp. UMB0228]RUQ05588.1 agmatinase [Microbacterium sp. HSID17254]
MTDNIGPVDASVNPRYSGIATFARLPRIEDVPRADIAVVGIPFDSGVSYRPGTRFGPSHVRESSRLLRPYNPAQDVSPFQLAQVVDAGDIPVNPFDLTEAVTEVERAAVALGDQVQRLVTIGGDHTVALPLLRAVAAKHGPVAVLHFDAHLDTWDTYFGAPITHGTPFRRASEEGLIDLTASCHVGTRGPLYSKQDLEDDERLGFSIVSSEYIEEHGVEAAIDRILTRIGDKPLYVSIDIDVLDPAHAPGTGTPEAGGLTSRELLRILRALRDRDIVGADVVEVSPAYDHAQMTGIAASHVVYELVTLLAARLAS